MSAKSNISELKEEILSCSKCRLAETASRAVPGEGNTNTEVIFLGEGPGKKEDETGRPFVGQGGRKLDELIESASMSRKDVYITNVVKHRPPENRAPERGEVEACKQFLEAEIDVINPSIIVTLGNTATRELLDTDRGISSIRGRFFFWREGIRIFPTFHPGYLVRNPSGDPLSPEEEARKDMKRIRKEIST